MTALPYLNIDLRVALLRGPLLFLGQLGLLRSL